MNPGDIIFGDIDGVVAITSFIEEEVIEKALEKARRENKVAIALNKGMFTQKAFINFRIM